MSSKRTLTDLLDYATVLPYASEMFGIYQPLLGWKSKRMTQRFEQGFKKDRAVLLERFKSQFIAAVDVRYEQNCQVRIETRPGSLTAAKLKTFDSMLLTAVAERLPAYAEHNEEQWPEFITRDTIAMALEQRVSPAYAQLYIENCRGAAGAAGAAASAMTRAGDAEGQRSSFASALESRLSYESSVAGALLYLVENEHWRELASLFYSVTDHTKKAAEIADMVSAVEVAGGYLDLEHMDPQSKEDIKRVALSPISIVHLFRQYFFELDTFLGSPVSHVWLSPGSVVELIEIQTRRTLVERSIEASTDTLIRTESTLTERDEISDAVKEDNKQDIKFGASVTASYASVTATASFDYASSQQAAREQTHKRMREQTDKLSTEIRKNYKTTFKTITEATDTSSKRYELRNTTSELINYELRRKMRQVAVQVQDIGSYLCWQTYVDRVGESLGVANLMHIAKPADLDGLPAPEEIPMLLPFPETKVVTIPFVSIEDTDADNEDEVYRDGVEVDDSEFGGELEKIQSDFPIECVCPKGNYVLANIEFDGQGKPVSASRRGDIVNTDNKASFTLHLDSVDFQGQNSIQVKIILHWSPAEGANDEAIAKNNSNVAAFKAKQAAEYQAAFVANAKERIKLTHEIKARPSHELREEERIVVYRELIQDLLTRGVTMADDRTRHVVAELINSIFDVDKMLYFVAPEWWQPQFRDHSQQLDESNLSSAFSGKKDFAHSLDKKFESVKAKTTKTKLLPSTVGWGGVDDPNRDNYYITADSDPARFGSSLGWLMQLDGDNMRNAFLNAPWVKAVIPIRPGKEEAAVNWLKGVEGFNGIGDSDVYRSSNPAETDINGKPLDGQKMIDVIMDLARKIQNKHRQGIVNGKYPTAEEIADPALVDAANVVTATPIDRVYEHGFYPLQGGFRANVKGNYEIFDQWLEILPTDQVVPVEVKYNPKTGRQT